MERAVTMSDEKHSQNDAKERATNTDIFPTGDIADRVVAVRLLPGFAMPSVVSVKVSKPDQFKQSVKVKIDGAVSERHSNHDPETEGGAS